LKSYRVIYIDAFTQVPLTGNPCAVLPDAAGLTDEEMQAVARETNLSETAFVFIPPISGAASSGQNAARFRVRYFTPRGEIPFAGHPTIATAFALAEEGRIALEGRGASVEFEFNIGVLPVEVCAEEGRPTRVVMSQQKPVFGPTFTLEETAPCFGLKASELTLSPSGARGDPHAKDRAPNVGEILPQVVSTGVPFLIVPARDVDVLTKVQMQRDLLGALCKRAGVHSAFMFCLGGFSGGADTAARLFDPVGSGEDPFTGSATGCLGAYVVHHGLRAGPRLIAEQGHPLGRPGFGWLEIFGSADAIESVRLGGEAVRTLEGQLFVPDSLHA
jgi:trans-2,3-dihydro-3-hydroxyanthranilate isomerase